jgi:hypothetical protein
MVDPDCAGSPAVLRLAVTRHRDEDALPARRLLPQPGGHLIAINRRHAQVQQDEFRPPVPGCLQRLRTVAGDLTSWPNDSNSLAMLSAESALSSTTRTRAPTRTPERALLSTGPSSAKRHNTTARSSAW